MEIWINPHCSKCRTALSTLDATGEVYRVRRYLEQPPTTAELEEVLSRLGMEPWDLVRMGQEEAKPLAALAKDASTRAQWIAAMVRAPILIQRPIVTASDGTTVIGRDAEALARVVEAEKSA